MRILKKILKITAKVIAGIFAFYFLLSLVLVPLISPWIASWQATKILKTPVKVRTILFNPFLLRLNIKGFEIKDNNKQLILSLDRSWCDFSFLSLFKKIYRVESLGAEGLKVNAVLSEKMEINLLKLVPVEIPAPGKVKAQQGKPVSQKPSEAEKPKPLPIVVVDLITLSGSTVNFTDYSVNPNFATSINNINLRITNLSTKPDAVARATFEAKLDEKGLISAELSANPLKVPLSLETVFKLNDYALQILTPYVGKYTGRKVKSGKMSLSMDYKIEDNKLIATHKLLVDNFDFGDKVESKDVIHLPYGLALALLEDTQDKIKINLPVTGDMSKPDFHYTHLIGQFLKNFFMNLVTKPFSFLGSIAGAENASEELGSIRFLPGKTDLADSEKEKLNLIIKALNDRPNLNLKINGSYDNQVDWKAIKTDVFNNDFRVLRSDSTRKDAWVYQELYQRRFGIKALWRLTSSYRSKEGIYDEEKLNAEIKRQVIEEGKADKVALEALAMGRAKVVYDFVISAGLDIKRVSMGDPHEAKAIEGFVPLELSLTGFGDTFDGDPVLPTIK